MPPTLQDRSKFIRSLDVPAYEPRLRTALLGADAPKVADNNAAGYVDDGMLVSFVAGLTGEQKSDVLNSCLLAQLAATKKFDREKDTKNWYDFYRSVLENVGWVIQEFEFENFTASGSTFTVDQVVLAVLEAVATKDEAAVATETLNALKALSPNSGPSLIWESASHGQSAGNFQVATCRESGGSVAMSMGAFYFSTTQTTTRFLWVSYSGSSMTLYKGGQAMTLDDDVYATVRAEVAAKLGDRAKQFVADLQI